MPQIFSQVAARVYETGCDAGEDYLCDFRRANHGATPHHKKMKMSDTGNMGTAEVVSLWYCESEGELDSEPQAHQKLWHPVG